MGLGAGAAVAGTAAAAGGLSAGTGALIGGGISAGASLLGGVLQSGNAGQAAKTSQRNLELMLPQIQQNYVNQQGLYQPFYGSGQQGLGAETDLLGLNGPDAAAAAMSRFQASPGYQYQLEQGLRGVDAGAASRGMLRSGSTIKAEETLGQNLANQDFGNYFSRINALAGQGLTAAGDLGAAGNNLIAGMQGNATSQNALAVGSANAENSIIGNTTSGLGNTLNSLLQNKDVQTTLGGLFGGGSNPFPSGNVSGTQNNTGLIPSGGFVPSGSNTWYW